MTGDGESSLVRIAQNFATTIITAVQQEYPNAPRHVMRADDDRPIPREIHPAFYGCFDWHSAVEMHWALAALVRTAPEAEFARAAREVLDRHLAARNLRTEADYLAANPAFERPYGWGWALQLADELAGWAEAGDEQAREWAANMRPLADAVERGFVNWLPRPAYPDRSGMHSNSAFALSRALPYAQRRAADGAPALRDAIGAAAQRWFGHDEDYSAAFEPSGADFLSPALTEIVLMESLLDRERFTPWYRQFNGGRPPAELARPAEVTDPEDGQGAHLHGLNLYRVHGFRRLLAVATAADEREFLEQAIEAHAEAGLAALTAEGWMAEHWLAAYGVLAFR